MLPILSGVVLRGQIGGLRGFSLSLTYVIAMAASFAVLGALMGNVSAPSSTCRPACSRPGC